MIRLATVASCLFALAACGGAEPDRAAAPHARADSAIYAILLDSLRGSADSVLVAREFDEFPDSAAKVSTLAAWVHKQSPAVDSGLVAALARARYGGSVQAILGHVRGVRWLGDRREFADSGPFFKYRVVSFTRLAYDSRGARAVVYASMGCGGLCGNGSFYSFELRNGTWHQVAQVVLIVS